MELSDVIEELKDRFDRAKKVTNYGAVDKAIITVYCTLTDTQPEELKPYFEKVREVSNYSAEDKALLACCAHYKTNKPDE